MENKNKPLPQYDYGFCGNVEKPSVKDQINLKNIVAIKSVELFKAIDVAVENICKVNQVIDVLRSVYQGRKFTKDEEFMYNEVMSNLESWKKLYAIKIGNIELEIIP